MIVIGIDQSISESGICVRAGVGGLLEEEVLPQLIKTSPKGWESDVQRKRYIVKQMRGLIVEHEPSLVVMEGYAYGKNNKNSSSILDLVELGGMIKSMVWAKKVPLLIVPPTTLKKFATGSGNIKKELVLKEVYKRWGFDTSNNNLADAFVLSTIGYYYAQATAQHKPEAFIKDHATLIKPQKESLLALFTKEK